jgi:two-component system response regulator MprA
MWILVAEDEENMASILKQGLEEQHHRVTAARDGMEALAALGTVEFDVAILDVMMPALDGVEVARRMRAAGNQIPVLMLTARDAPADVIRGLDAGADDYLVKPFPFKVLLARLRALSRRAAHPQISRLQVGGLVLDPATREVTRDGCAVNLTATEFRFLEYLMRRAGRASSRDTIIEAVWGFDDEVERNTVDAFVKSLRDKIDTGQDRKLIHTVRGFGYILREQP